MSNYIITLTQNQAKLISIALDTFIRIEIGHFESVIENSNLYYNSAVNTENVSKCISELKKEFSLSPNGNYGIYNTDKVCQSARESFAIKKLIDHQLWLDSEEKNLSSVSSDNNTFNHNEPRITITKQE